MAEAVRGSTSTPRSWAPCGSALASDLGSDSSPRRWPPTCAPVKRAGAQQTPQTAFTGERTPPALGPHWAGGRSPAHTGEGTAAMRGLSLSGSRGAEAARPSAPLALFRDSTNSTKGRARRRRGDQSKLLPARRGLRLDSGDPSGALRCERPGWGVAFPAHKWGRALERRPRGDGSSSTRPAATGRLLAPWPQESGDPLRSSAGGPPQTQEVEAPMSYEHPMGRAISSFPLSPTPARPRGEN